MRLASVVAILVAGCAGATAEQPLTVGLDQSRPAAEKAIRSHQFCRQSHDPPQREELYPRCDRTGTEWGDAWVRAIYEGDTLVELRRYERYTDDTVAVQRWNQLVGDRARLHPGAEVDLAKEGKLLEPGTRTVRAFRVDARTVVAVYLLTPSAPDNAAVLELVTRAGPRP